MNTLVGLFISLLLGVIAGIIFFGGLLMTVRRLVQAPHPYYLAIVSFILRFAAIGVIFVSISYGGHWERLLACMLGFVMTRMAVVRYVQRKDKQSGADTGRNFL